MIGTAISPASKGEEAGLIGSSKGEAGEQCAFVDESPIHRAHYIVGF
ncbi:hypothetical protein BV98_002280 [Sphingobium herbicidovorans NBRC 16415]|uniref:Uncharacterized protein n=1 Tax=Sphingobium herbicidovorans (strain ATCC 700291 / DSM 11019 / CCUG 56400 / KCTC 2939 / LMG 18315 / NBRC 16415 / MH) TaxID=1219045 RepID=A0A086P9B6_SPHHM|nr:hypothetical protein BV98_002280 [Sphingobium herbicidovorans NBRC 16415]